MIVLKVEDYCHNCPEFEPELEKDMREAIGIDITSRTETREVYCKTTVTCVHCHRCAAVYQRAVEFVNRKNDTATCGV